MKNTSIANVGLPMLVEHVTRWHHDRNLIEGTTSQKQFVKLMEEVIEVYMALNPHTNSVKAVLELTDMIRELGAKGRIKTCDGSGLADAIGDTIVVLDNIAEREGFTLEHCLAESYAEIKDRKGRMVDGTFVKEADL